MTNANNDIDIVAEMGDSQKPSALSLIKSPEKRTLSEFAAKNSCLSSWSPVPATAPSKTRWTTAYNKICQKAEQDLLQLLIHEQQINSSTDAEAISSLKQQLNQMFPDQTKREKAEKRIQSAANRSLTRTNLIQKIKGKFISF